MDSKLIQEITDRVLEAKKAREDESILAAHLDAIADVYEADRDTVESIARNVLNEHAESVQRGFDLPKITRIVWICALVLIMISVIWLLYRSTQTPQTVSTQSSIAMQLKLEYVNQAIAAVNVLKINIAEHRQVHGVWPNELSEIGARRSDYILNKYIENIELTEGATIVIHLNDLIGSQHYVTLRPLERIGSDSFEWQCTTNLASEITQLLNQCSSDDS